MTKQELIYNLQEWYINWIIKNNADLYYSKVFGIKIYDKYANLLFTPTPKAVYFVHIMGSFWYNSGWRHTHILKKNYIFWKEIVGETSSKVIEYKAKLDA